MKLSGGLGPVSGAADNMAKRRREKRFEKERKRREKFEAAALVVQTGPLTRQLQRKKGQS
jgi:hypothetical protein